MPAPMPTRYMPNRPYPLGTALPTVYDGSWQSYTNLTPQQIAAFQAFPQDLLKYNSQVRWQYENRIFPSTQSPLPNPYISVTVPGGMVVPVYLSANCVAWIMTLQLHATANASATFSFTARNVLYSLSAPQALAVATAVRGYIQQCRAIEGQQITAINNGTTTQQSQIDAAFAVLN